MAVFSASVFKSTVYKTDIISNTIDSIMFFIRRRRRA